MHATRRIRNTGDWKAARMLRAAALLLALCLSGGVALRTGATGETYNWYCAHVRGHMQPRADGRFAFIRDCGGFYIDDRPEHTAADGADKVVYLTFDAGYENGNVARVLDALAQADAAGAFFVLGNLARQNPDLIRRMAAEGHIVGNHTYHHPDMSAISDKASFQKELDSLAALYQEITGQELSHFYRPPQGKYSEQNLKLAQELGYQTVFWSLAYVDWYADNQPTAEQAYAKLLPRIHNGAIVLLHSTSSTNAAILDDLLTKWEDMGYRFAPLTELSAPAKS